MVVEGDCLVMEFADLIGRIGADVGLDLLRSVAPECIDMLTGVPPKDRRSAEKGQ